MMSAMKLEIKVLNFEFMLLLFYVYAVSYYVPDIA